jgi:hypothetical protein
MLFGLIGAARAITTPRKMRSKDCDREVIDAALAKNQS